MAPKITDEMRDALAQRPGQPILVEDAQSNRTYLLVDAGEGRKLTEQWIREQLQLGLEAADRGDVVPFDADAIKATGRHQLGQSN